MASVRSGVWTVMPLTMASRVSPSHSSQQVWGQAARAVPEGRLRGGLRRGEAEASSRVTAGRSWGAAVLISIEKSFLTGVFFSIAQPQGGGKGIVSLPVL